MIFNNNKCYDVKLTKCMWEGSIDYNRMQCHRIVAKIGLRKGHLENFDKVWCPHHYVRGHERREIQVVLPNTSQP